MCGLAELPWYPNAFRDWPHVAWCAIGIDKLRASCDDGNIRASVVFDGAKTVVETPWAGSFGEYKTFESLRVPTRSCSAFSAENL
jgi:hypothetical protein